MSWLVQVGVRVLERVLPVLERDQHPDVVGRLGPADVAADVRGEVAAGAGVQRRRERDRQRERPHGLALGLLLEGHGEHPLVDAGLDELAGDDARSTRRPSRRCAPGTAACPSQPSASARYSSGIITPSKKSGALPIDDRVDVGPGHLRRRPAPGGRPPARARPSTRRPGSAWCLVWPIPTTATRSLPISVVPFQDAHQVLLQARAAGGVGDAPVGLAGRDAGRHLADADEAGGHHRVGGQRRHPTG